MSYFATEIDFGEENKCMICLDPLTTEQQYTLPECKHAFHQNCIMHWFRQGNSKCPLCNNLGVGHHPLHHQPFLHDTPWTLAMARFRMVRQYSRRKIAPPRLKKQIALIKKHELQLKDIKKELREFKNKEGNWGELMKKWRKLRSRRWKKKCLISRRKRAIGAWCIPLIIAKKVSVGGNNT